MKPLSVVVAQQDPKFAEVLAASLNPHFRAVSVARSVAELRTAIPKHRADLAVVDLEMASLPDIAELRREFPQTVVVCTHRAPDEEMWPSVMEAGASDFCQSSDVRSIVMAVSGSIANSAAA
jgi:DNA-binding NarL/FixJ family response regulator